MTPTDSPNKAAAISFLRLAVSGNAREALFRHAAPGFRHHNPSFRGDGQSLAQAMDQNATENPGKTFQVERALEDGDLVAVHSRVRLKKSGPEIAVIHIFRFDDGRIAELWDVGQAMPPDSPNENGMF